MTNTPLTLTTEARAWLTANKGWSAGIPTEIVGLKLQGQDSLKAYKTGHKHVECSGPNAQRQWYREGHSTKTGAGAPPGQILTGWGKDAVGNNSTLGENTAYRTPLAAHYQDEELPAFVTAPVYTEAQVLTTPAVNTRIEAKADTQELRDTTWTTYTKNTKTLWAAKGIHSSRKYQLKVQQLDKQLRAAMDTDTRGLKKYGRTLNQTVISFDAACEADIQAQTMLELVEVLQQNLTPRQLQLLEDKAFGTPVRGSSHKQLQAARVKAQAVLKSLQTYR